MTINILILCVFAAALLYKGLRDIAGIAMGESRYLYGQKQLSRIAKATKVKRSIWETAKFKPLLTALGAFIFIEQSKESKLTEQLKKAKMLYTPKEYTAKKFLFSGIGIIVILFCYMIGFIIGIPIGVILTLFLYFLVNDELKHKLTLSNIKILLELPQFIRAVITNMKTDRDLIHIVERYIPIAKETGLKPELITLVADLKSGNTETALMRFDTRLGLPEISRLVVILINIERGVDQTNALTFLANDMMLIARENIKRQYSVRPAKLNQQLLPCIVVDIIALMYVLVYSVMISANQMV